MYKKKLNHFNEDTEKNIILKRDVLQHVSYSNENNWYHGYLNDELQFIKHHFNISYIMYYRLDNILLCRFSKQNVQQ